MVVVKHDPLHCWTSSEDPETASFAPAMSRALPVELCGKLTTMSVRAPCRSFYSVRGIDRPRALFEEMVTAAVGEKG